MINKKKANLFQIAIRFILITGVVALLAPQICLADVASKRLEAVLDTPGAASYSRDTTEETLASYIGDIVAVALGFLGTIFVILIVYGGYTWMTATGNTEKVTKAQHTIKVAFIGLFIVIAAYAIWVFVFSKIVKT